MAATEIRDGLCGICPAGCWVRAYCADGRLLKVEPYPDHPMGMLCRIGRHSPAIVHDPDRLKTPLRRIGPKGGYNFEPVSWDAAMAEIAERLQGIKAESGPEATAIYTGRGSFDMALCDLMQPAGVAVSSASSVLFPFGSPNTLGVGALCYVSFAMIAPHVTMGEMLITMDTDIQQAELIVIWGANPATDSPPLAHHQIVQAAANGARVVAIDPRRTETAREVDAQWLAIRPGTDGALALAMIQVLLEEEIYDESFAEQWTVGFEELGRFVQHYRPEVVETITGIAADDIRQLARALASARGACPVMYTGLEYSDSGVQAIRAVFTLWALAGQLDVPGGLLFRMKENLFPQNRTHLQANPDVRKALGRDRFPVYSMFRGESHAIALPDAVLKGEPYFVKSLIILGGSLCTSWPNPELWRKTLAALDFLVTIDRYHTADSAYADIVLPATTMYEITSYMRYGPLFKIRERLLWPQGQARNDFLILAELAERLGYGHLYPQTEEGILARALEGTGFHVEGVREAGGAVQIPAVMMEYKKWEKGRLRPDGQPGFNTPSGKFEIASAILTEYGYGALPEYTEPAEGPLSRPDLAATFPLVFNSGSRTLYDFRSQHHGVRGLAERQPEPRVTINVDDARVRAIQDNDWVWVETPRGRLRFRARVTADIVRGAVDANMGGGGPLGPKAWRETNVNILTDLDRFDPISGFPIYKTLLCQVSKAAAGEENATSAGSGGEVERPLHFHAAKPVRQVYLDHNATTPLAPEVVDAMRFYWGEEFGNPSSLHRRGNTARNGVEAARRSIAQSLNCTARRILFTGSGSEADNLAIQGVLKAHWRKGNHVITSAIEHPAVLATCRALEAQGAHITILPVDDQGVVSPRTLEKAICPDTVLVSIMLANNETGVVQSVAELAAIARGQGVLFHTDAVQALGKIPLDVDELGVDLLSISAHKVYGPKGVGALYVRKGVRLAPLIHGGGQEHGLRSGTENVASIVGFGRACELARQRQHNGDNERQARLRDRLARGVRELIAAAKVNGQDAKRLPNTLNMVLPGIRGESLVTLLDRRGIAFSSGSACKAGAPEPSAALLAMGLTTDEAHCSIRFSLGYGTTEEDIVYCLDCLREVVDDTRSAIRFVACR